MPDFITFRINKTLLEDIREIRLNSPELDYQPVKLALNIQQTLIPGDNPIYFNNLLEFYSVKLNQHLKDKNFDGVNLFLEKKKKLAIKLRKIMFEKIAEIKKRVEAYSDKELEAQLEKIEHLIFQDFNDLMTLTESNMLIQEAIKRNLILY